MKKILTLLLVGLSVVASANDKKIEKSVVDYLSKNLILADYDKLGSKLAKTFPDTKVFVLRIKQDNGWSSLGGMKAVSRKGKTELFSDSTKLNDYIVSLYKNSFKNTK